MSNQMHRFLTAFLGIALALTAVPLSKYLTAYTRATTPEQTVSSDVSFAAEHADSQRMSRYTTEAPQAVVLSHSFDSALVVHDLFEHMSGVSLSTEVPYAFLQEVIPMPAQCTYAYSNHDVVGFVVAQDSSSLQNEIVDTLLGNGWQRIDVGTSVALEKTNQIPQYSFAKATGTYQWLHVAFYPMASTTTCTFTLHRKDST